MSNQNIVCIDLKRSVCECISTSSLNINCDDIIECVREDIDINKFKTWLQYNENKIKSKTNQTSYFKKSFLIELEKGTFKPKNKDNYLDVEILDLTLPTLYKYLPMFTDNVKEGFGDETFFIENLQIYLYRNDILTIDEINVLNSKVLNYITTFENVKLSDYREYIKKSQLLKGKVDWEEVEKIEAQCKQDFEKMMKDFEVEKDD